MSDATDQTPVEQTEGSPRSVALLIAAAVLIVGVVVAVLLFGIVRPPALEPLAESGLRPSGAVTWMSWSDGESCLSIAWPDGNITEPYCSRDGGDVIAWRSDGVVLRTWTSTGESELTIDPVSGQVLDRRHVNPERDVDRPESGERIEWVRSYRDDAGLLVVELESSGDVVWRLDAPDAYTINSGVRSPDRNWVALVDSARRLLVVPADGSADPAVWTDEFDSWQTIVWQGTQ